MEPKTAVNLTFLNRNVRADLNLAWPNAVILACAIMVACVGLNMNSTPVVIGAMLLSPLMSPIVGVGFGIAVSDAPLIARAVRLFLVEVAIAVVASTLYFALSPLKEASQQLIARTAPTLWDVLIALFGGLAGVIGSAKKEGGNVIPGVAIATALMPPLCTVGYGLSQQNWTYVGGAAYLFLINSFFIGLATTAGTVYFRLRSGQKLAISWRRQLLVLAAAVIVAIPSLISASGIIRQSYDAAQVNQFVEANLADEYVASQDIKDDTITLSLIGSRLSQDQISRLEKMLPAYHLDGYQLNVRQLNSGDYMTTAEFKTYMQQAAQPSSAPAAATSTAVPADLTSLQAQLLKDYPQQIDQLYVGRVADRTGQTKNLAAITLTAAGRQDQAAIRKRAQALAKKAGLSLTVRFFPPAAK